ncbi:MAG TPA: hypothetical protein GX403_06225, partial [Rhodocyclaceae bacterium]|nr:hypothetical protein [Rhodocyclaceae bacterium]
MRRRVVVALLAGGASVFAYAPFEWYPLALIAVGMLAWLLAGVARIRHGFALGFAWGFGAFVGGVSWLYVALERYGGMPAPLAALAIALFCAYLALYPGLAGAAFVALLRRRTGLRSSVAAAAAGAVGAFAHAGVEHSLSADKPAACASAAPTGPVLAAALFGALWLLAEWLRGVVFTGFPWLALGYSQTPPSPLAGYLPLIGVYGVGGLAAFVAALVVFLPAGRGTPARRWAPVAVVGVVLVLGMGLAGRAWTVPTGAPLPVALVQTNFEQSLKWDPDRFADVLQVNLDLVRAGFADDERPALVVLPETTLPTLLDRLPEGYLDW